MEGRSKLETLRTTKVRFKVNGKLYEFDIGPHTGQIRPWETLAETLRETLRLTGTKISCDDGSCGCCTVIMDGKAVLSCIILTADCDGKEILTIEGLKEEETGRLDPLQQAFIQHNAFQCGFCTPGMIMSAKALLNRNPQPSEDVIKEALSGNFCRCGSYYQVLRAVKSAAEGGG